MKDDIATLWRAELDSSVDAPLQRQLYDQIRNGILQSDLPGGARLPSSRELAARLGVARVTVVQCYEQLIAEGYLETKSGAGTFVSAARPDTLVSMRPSSALLDPVRQKPAQQPLLSGMPALDQFPKAKWARTAARTARRLDTNLMHHSDIMGYFPLRTAIAGHLRSSRNVVCNPDQVMIISGLQQGLFILASAVLAPDQPIIMEDPGYDGMLDAAKATGRTVAFTDVDEAGACPPSNKKGLLVTSPSRQYPLGYTMPHARRLELLAWAKHTGSLILEDDYDSEFRYAGHPLNSLQGIDGDGHVIYGGTFSKSVFPALRLGYLVVPTHLVDAVKARRQAIDSFPSITNQQILYAFMEDGEFGRHIRRLRKVHAERKDLFEASAANHLAAWLDVQPSDAGLHLLARYHPKMAGTEITDARLADIVRTYGIGAAPVSRCYQKAPARQGLMLGFANLPAQQIEPALQRLAGRLAEETGFSS